MEKEPLFNDNIFDDDINIRQIIEQYLSYWPWYIFSIILFGLFGYLYVKYAKPIYQAKGSILIEKENNSILGDFTVIEEMFGTSNVVDDQILMIKSIPNLQTVVEKLNLDVLIQRRTKYTKKLVEVYENKPFLIEQTYLKENILKEPITFSVELLDNKKYKFTYNKFEGEFAFGQNLKIGDFLVIKILPNLQTIKEENDSYEYFITINPIRNVILSLNERLVVETAIKNSKTTNAIALSIESSSEKKSVDVLNQVIQEYFNNDILQKKLISEKTYEFIQDRLSVISTELSGVESDLEKYKTSNKIFDIATEGQLFAGSSVENKEALKNAQIQLSIIEMMQKEISNNEGILPVNIGLSDVNIAANIKVYNDLIIQDMQYKNSISEKNPERIALAKNINTLRENIKASLKNIETNNRLLVNNLLKQDRAYEKELQLLPSKEKVLREISRQQQTKEALFLFLLQKREEVAISTISIKPDAKIISPAFCSGEPISPQKGKLYLIFLALGLIIPTLFIYIADLFDTKIHSVAELEKESRIPVLSSILKTRKSGTQKILGKQDRAYIIESFRILVTNLVFSLSHIGDKKNKTLLVTSTVAGEGKTFIASNLAAFLTYSNYKVVVIGMDFRAPSLNTFFTNDKNIGITHFIKDDELKVDDIINSTQVENLDVIFPGQIAPVFLDITKSRRLSLLINELKERYDYVIIDTAPVGLVSETLSFAPFADMCLFVVRANYLDKRKLKISEKLFKEKRFADYRLILNAITLESSEYGYGYGDYSFKNKNEDKFWHIDFWRKKFS